MFDCFNAEFKEDVTKSLVGIASDLKFKNPEKVFPVLQITCRKTGDEKSAPEALRSISETITPIEAEALVYLLKSVNEYYFLSLSISDDEVVTDGKALGEYHEDLLKNIAPNIPITSIAYGNAECSINFNTVNVAPLFFNPLDAQEEYLMDYSTQFHREDIKGFVKNFAM